ncbi:MAG: MucB/RseB C-terminal domain-containing protein [Pseudomonadota bacterium]
MIDAALRSRLLLVCAAGMALIQPVSAGSDDPRVWIARMNQALATRNYDGVFVTRVGEHRETLRIIHRVKDGRMSERLVSTDGSGREFVRNGPEWVAYYPDRKIAIAEQRNRPSGFIASLNGLSKETDNFYEIRYEERQRLQGVNTRVITVRPRDGLRYGYRFWIDEKTGMPYRTQLESAGNEIIEEISFIALSLPETISDDMLKPDVDAAGFKWLRRDAPSQRSDVKVTFVPRTDLLPVGFRVTVANGPIGSDTGPRTRFIISDGLAWVSVFVETAGPPADKTDSKSGHEISARHEGAVQMGASAVYSLRQDGHRITAVGEVPPATAKAIAESLRRE